MIRTRAVLATAGSALALVVSAQATSEGERPPKSLPGRAGWELANYEDFHYPLSVNEATGILDPMTAESPWAVDRDLGGSPDSEPGLETVGLGHGQRAAVEDGRTWPAASANPDSFIIGDPRLNFYQGSAVVDDIRLFLPDS